MEKCNKEHDIYGHPYVCVKNKGHEGWCGCSPRSDRYNITIFDDGSNEVIQGDSESLTSLARAILTAVETKRASSLLTRWGLLNIQNTDALGE